MRTELVPICLPDADVSHGRNGSYAVQSQVVIIFSETASAASTPSIDSSAQAKTERRCDGLIVFGGEYYKKHHHYYEDNGQDDCYGGQNDAGDGEPLATQVVRAGVNPPDRDYSGDNSTY